MTGGVGAGLSSVERVLSALDRDRGATIVLHGPQGSGRTTWCEQIVASSDGRSVIRVRATPGAPATEVLDGLDGVFDRARADHRVLVVIDDADLIDEPSEALRDLARAARRCDAAVVLAAAEPGRLGLDQGDAHWIDIPPLTAHDIAVLAESITSRVPGDLAISRLAALSDGNLRTAAELIRALSPGQLRTGAGIDESTLEALPFTRLVASRMRELPEPVRTALCAAALGRREALGTMQTALEQLGSSVDELAPAEAARWVTVRSDGITFGHPLHRVAARSIASFHERRRIAGALARATGVGDELRAAWYEAIDAVAPDEPLAERLHRLAERTMAGGDPLFASEVWRAAARLTSNDPGAALLHAASAAQVGGRLDEAVELAGRVLAGSPTPVQRAEARRVQSLVLIWQGHPGRAHDLLAAEAELLAPYARFEATGLLLQGTLGALHAGHLDTADRLAARAADLGHDLGPLGTAAVAIAGNTRTLLGDPRGIAAVRAARRLHVEAEPFVVAAPPVLHLTSWVGRMLAELGDIDDALVLLDWTVQQANEHGFTTYEMMPLAHRVATRIRRGDLRDAALDLARLEEIVELYGQAEHRLTVTMLRGSLDVLEGRAGGAVLLGDAVNRSSGPARVEALVALGQAAMATGDVDEALHVLQRAHDMCTASGLAHPGFAPHEADLVEALVRHGDVDHAAVIAKGQADVASRWDIPLVQGLAERSLALTAGDPEAEAEHATRSLDLLDRARAPIEWARTALCRGERLRRRRAPRAARPFLRSALDTFERAGAVSWAARARAELRAAGGPQVAPVPTALAGLTAREAAIAGAVADGRTNREVAAALHLSPKTIENQLSRIYAKLGVRSRTEMARVVRASRPD